MSNVYQKSEFYDAATSELSSGNYPALSARLALGDVTFTQQLGAMAQMLAMLSYQLGLAEVEPWIKARDNMVLADAAMRVKKTITANMFCTMKKWKRKSDSFQAA